MTLNIVGAGIHTANALGSVLSRMGFPLVSLDERDLLDAARRATGLDDFGDDDFRDRLGLLLSCLETEADLTLVGRIAASRDIIGLLINRLRLAGGSQAAPGDRGRAHRRAHLHRGPAAKRQHPAPSSPRPGPGHARGPGVGSHASVAPADARNLRDRSPHRADAEAAPLARLAGSGLQGHSPGGSAAPARVHRHHERVVPGDALSDDLQRSELRGVAEQAGHAPGLCVPSPVPPAPAVGGAGRLLGPEGPLPRVLLRCAARHLSRRAASADAP